VKSISLLSCLATVSLALATPAQALIPHTVTLDFETLEAQGNELMREAFQLAQFQQFPLALQRAELATQLVPRDFRPWALVAEIYRSTDQVDESIAALEQAQRYAPEEPAILFALGTSYFRKEDYGQAAAFIEQGLTLKPDEPAALFDLGNVYYVQKRLDEAIDTFEAAIDQKDDFWEAINNIGLVKYEQGKEKDALKYWRRSVDINDEVAEPQLAIAVAHYARGDEDKGLELGTAALELDYRYGDLEFLAEQLWGERLLEDTAEFLAIPSIEATIEEARRAAADQR
jgi:tetratricopeptide (TPR) repeat protein